MRKTVELRDLNQEMMRLVIYSRQGYKIYINGKLVVETRARYNIRKPNDPRFFYAKPRDALYRLLKPGTNTIAATSFVEYVNNRNGGYKNEGYLEVYLEGLKTMPKP